MSEIVCFEFVPTSLNSLDYKTRISKPKCYLSIRTTNKECINHIERKKPQRMYKRAKIKLATTIKLRPT